MRTVNAKKGCVIPIGRLGENEVTTVVFDISDYPAEGTLNLLFQRNGDTAAYPCIIERDGSIARWTVKSSDVAVSGYGKCELIYLAGSKIAKSEIYTTVTGTALDGSGEVPEPWESWVDSVLSAKTAAELSAFDASASSASAYLSEQHAAASAEASAQAARTAISEGIETETIYPGGGLISGLDTINRFVNDSGTWTVRSASEKNSYVIPTEELTAVRVKSHADRGNYVSMLKTLSFDYVDFCDGFEGRHQVAAGQTEELIVPSGCNFALIQRKPSTATISDPQEIATIISSGSIFEHEKRLNTIEAMNNAEAVKSVIIGASIEAGTTHETSTSGAVVNASKAYLTVALQRNGHDVTNLSHGGMGYLRTASSGGYTFKGIIDSTDFSAFDCAWICLGVNDWNYNLALGSASDTSTADTVCGRLKYGIEKIMQSNPFCKIFVKLPEIRGSKGDITSCWGWNTENTATVPYTEAQLEAAIESVCSAYNVQTFGRRGGGIVNALNLETVLPDKTHPSVKTMALMADAMTGAIPYKRRA